MRRGHLRLCVDRIISDETAAMPSGRGGVRFWLDTAPRDIKLAVAAAKRWPNAYELRCTFMDGSNTQRGRVQSHAQTWADYANIRFRFDSPEDPEIRISFSNDAGSWSAVGTDALNRNVFPISTPTMNFGWLRDDTSETDCRSVVLHEFGHALGAIHEHQQPESSLNWNKRVVFRAFSGPPNNWTRQEIVRNVLHKYSKQQTNWTGFDGESIMLYHFPPELFLDGVGTALNTDLSAHDKKFISSLYPGRWRPIES